MADAAGPTPVPQVPVHPQPPQFEIPSFRAPDVQMLVQDLAASRRDLFEERRNSQNRIAEERERSRFEIEKVRSEAAAQVKALERENEALLRGLGRLQSENDKLREENAVLRQAKSNGQVDEKIPAPAIPPAPLPQDLASQFNRAPGMTKVPLVAQVPLKGYAPVMLSPQIMGGPQIIQPGVGPV